MSQKAAQASVAPSATASLARPLPSPLTMISSITGSGAAATSEKCAVLRAISTGENANATPASQDSQWRPHSAYARRAVHHAVSAIIARYTRLKARTSPSGPISGYARMSMNNV